MKKMYIALIIVLAIIIGWYVYHGWQKRQNNSLSMPEDKNLVAYNLDDLASIKVPSSFEQNNKFTIANFYGLDPITNKFVYSFYLKRAEYNDLGGYRRMPVTLTLSVYDSKAAFDNWNDYVYSNQTGYSSTSTWDTSVQSINLEKKIYTNIDKLNFVGMGASNPQVTLLVYSYQNQDIKYRLGLSYWQGYLTDEDARKLLDNTAQTIVIKGTLPSRIKAIEDEFYKKYPDKKP